jgi:hypothetical protein
MLYNKRTCFNFTPIVKGRVIKIKNAPVSHSGRIDLPFFNYNHSIIVIY